MNVATRMGRNSAETDQAFEGNGHDSRGCVIRDELQVGAKTFT
jgi:hypothetical protein